MKTKTEKRKSAIINCKELFLFFCENETHFAAFLKHKKLTIIRNINGGILINDCENSFSINIDYKNKTIESTEKPAWPKSISYVEILDYAERKTKFKIKQII